MKKLFLHIGMPKTGTSAVQRFFARNRKLLESEGLLYPDFRLRYENAGKNRNAHWLHKLDYNEETAEACFQKLQEWSGQYDRILISDEGIWNQNIWDTSCWKEGFFPWLKGRLHEIGMELEIIVFLRRQDEFFYSYWSQMVKEKSVETFSEYFKSRNSRLWKNRLDLYRNLQRIEEAVGSEHMIVRFYQTERYKEHSGLLVSDFLELLDIDPGKDWIMDDRRVNISLTDVPLEVCRRMNQDPEIKVQTMFAYSLLKRVQSEREEKGLNLGRPYFSAEDRRRLLEPYAEGNRKVEEHYLKSPGAEQLTISAGTEKEESQPEISVQEITDVYNRLLFLQEENLQSVKEELALTKKELAKAKRSLTERIARRLRRRS